MSSANPENVMEEEFKDMKLDDPEEELFSKGAKKQKNLYGRMKSRLFGSSDSSKITAKAQEDASSLADRVVACRSPTASPLGGIKIQVQMCCAKKKKKVHTNFYPSILVPLPSGRSRVRGIVCVCWTWRSVCHGLSLLFHAMSIPTEARVRACSMCLSGIKYMQAAGGTSKNHLHSHTWSVHELATHFHGRFSKLSWPRTHARNCTTKYTSASAVPCHECLLLPRPLV